MCFYLPLPEESVRRYVRWHHNQIFSDGQFQIFVGMELYARACARRRYKLLLFSLKLQNAAERPSVLFEFICFYPNIKQKRLANFILNVTDSFPMHYTSLISTWDCYALFEIIHLISKSRELFFYRLYCCSPPVTSYILRELFFLWELLRWPVPIYMRVGYVFDASFSE